METARQVVAGALARMDGAAGWATALMIYLVVGQHDV
jgi:hypothetical protein